MGANGAMGAAVRRMKSSIFRSFKEIFSAGQVGLIRSVGKGSTFGEILNHLLLSFSKLNSDGSKVGQTAGICSAWDDKALLVRVKSISK